MARKNKSVKSFPRDHLLAYKNSRSLEAAASKTASAILDRSCRVLLARLDFNKKGYNLEKDQGIKVFPKCFFPKKIIKTLPKCSVQLADSLILKGSKVSEKFFFYIKVKD